MYFQILSKPEINIFPKKYFHVTKNARDKYEINEMLFSIYGRIVFGNFNAVKILTDKMNSIRNIEKEPLSTISPSLLNAMGLMDEILHFMLEKYKNQIRENPFKVVLKNDSKLFGSDLLNLLKNFIGNFPNNEIYSNKITVDEYLTSKTEGVGNKEIIIEELLVNWIQNQNKVYKNTKELIDDSVLNKTKTYKQFINSIKKYFKGKPSFGDSKISLIEMLQKPAKLHPDSIYDQLKYIYDNWGDDLKPFLSRILISLDYFKEEAKRFDGELFGNMETEVAQFGDEYTFEPEAFSQDKDWMPHLVLMAKSTYVWLDQLSKEYQREIKTLDQIPDQELNRLANFGFTGLWLIGLWERSFASQKIKQINGNSEAVASAYSLKNYEIANDIGGYAAYQNLKERAWQRGIRLASDMVPNHMGIDSDWVMNHPNWFIQTQHPPFPQHTYNGPDLSNQPAAYIFLEDGYWNKSDASVTFKRVDKNTGESRFIYHGNDGTGMPWNDTAQLNYLMPEVRKAVINTIVHVAHLFPIIRFDAAMTLAKKHYQRLWFPNPGSGGDIPTRSEYAMTKDEFDKHFPVEFWREVVDRIHQECPDTLLLAEAFWMMEGYFVRTLGMHRVYNSAFMHMLKNEENGKYREMIKNVLEFNPQILKRYVNFMNNPDEDTAVDQFGKDDKYFGICILMSTMPGLPMFGHGQIEGYHEKYGMEYKKAYWDEQPDEYLIARHKKEIFPILKKRKLFSEVENYFLYNFWTENHVNENVFCYSNMYENERALVIYNNVYNSTAGWIKESAGYNDGSENIVTKNLAQALRLNVEGGNFIILKDIINNLEYIRSSKEIDEKGFYSELNGFKYQVFFIKEVQSSIEKPYEKIIEKLHGSAVESIEESLHEIKIEPVLIALGKIFKEQNLESLYGKSIDSSKGKRKSILIEIEKAREEVFTFAQVEIKSLLKLNETGFLRWSDFLTTLKNLKLQRLSNKYLSELVENNDDWDTFSSINIISDICRYILDPLKEKDIILFYDYWRFEKCILNNFGSLYNHVFFIKVFSCYTNLGTLLFDEKAPKNDREELFNKPAVRKYLKINQYKDVYYLNKEQWETFVDVCFVYQLYKYITADKPKEALIKTFINKEIKKVIYLKEKAAQVGYNLAALIKGI